MLNLIELYHYYQELTEKVIVSAQNIISKFLSVIY